MSQHLATGKPNAPIMLRPIMRGYVAWKCCDHFVGRVSARFSHFKSVLFTKPLLFMLSSGKEGSSRDDDMHGMWRDNIHLWSLQSTTKKSFSYFTHFTPLSLRWIIRWLVKTWLNLTFHENVCNLIIFFFFFVKLYNMIPLFSRKLKGDVLFLHCWR